MNRIQFHAKVHHYLAILIAFSLPFARLTPVFISLLFLNWLIEGDFKNKFQSIFKNKLAILFTSFYLLHLIGLIYTQNIYSGLFDIQVKFSLLLFPLIFASRPLIQKELNVVFVFFIAGAILTSLIMLGRAIYLYNSLGNIDCFFYQSFSFLIHPSYLSMYLNVAIVWLLINMWQNKFSTQRFLNFFALLIISFFAFINVLLASKMGLLTMILVFIGFLIYYIVSRKKYILGFAGIFLITISIYSIIHFVPTIRTRVNTAISAITDFNTNQTQSESTAVRLLVWKAANKVISENLFFGVGTGDTKDVLLNEYKNRGMTGALEHKLNTHNAFYQVFISLGIIGFILFLANLFIPLRFSFRTSKSLYLVFLLIIIFNFLTESMLETQAGVMFYAFFNSMICFCCFETDYIEQKKVIA